MRHFSLSVALSVCVYLSCTSYCMCACARSYLLLTKAVCLWFTQELYFHEMIGKGSFKTVYRGRWNNTNVAIVSMRRGGMVTEARVLQRMSNHPNLVQFYRLVLHWYCAQMASSCRLSSKNTDTSGMPGEAACQLAT